MKYTILHRHTGEFHHAPEYDISMENRILADYQVQSTFEELYEFICSQTKFITDKKHGDLLIPAEFVGEDEDHQPATYKDEDGTRKNRINKETGGTYVGREAMNVKTLCMFPLDIDGGMTIEDARKKFSDYQYILYTSYNHMADGKTHKFRMFFEYAAPIARDAYKTRRKAMLEFFGGGDVIDETTTYLSRGFYLAGFCEERAEHIVVEFNDGKKLDPMSFDEEVIVPYEGAPSESTDEERKEILEKLKLTTIGSYKIWWQMLQAMKSESYSIQDALYVTADNPYHSSTSTGIKSAELTRDIWSGCKEQNGGVGKLITIIRVSFPEFRNKKAQRALELSNKKIKLQQLRNKLGGR